MHKALFALFVVCTLGSACGGGSGAPTRPLTDEDPLVLPALGAYQLRILSSNILELTLVATKAPDPARVTQWNFFDNRGQVHPPPASAFAVRVAGAPARVLNVGWKRRVLYAPVAKRD